jgi:putative transcriptional regulator
MPVETEDGRRLARRMAGEIVINPSPSDGIRKWRRVFEVSQVELAAHMGVSPSVISDYESGRRKSPRVGTIQRILGALIEIDRSRGGRTLRSLKRMMLPEMPSGVVLDMKEFSVPINAGDLAGEIRADVVVGEDLLDRQIFGYTVLDSLRAIVELRRDDFIRIYGMTSERALVFTGVASGRSPFVAIKVGGINPGVVVLHGKGLVEVDEIGKRIAERESIPVAISRMPSVGQLIKSLQGIG